MKSIIIDDHSINVVLVKSLLTEYFPEFKTIDSADSVRKAITMLEAKSYDLIFLDMKLGDGEGFEILKEATDIRFVIVISSHRDYAVEAFKHRVTDYLVKPVQSNEFRDAVTKVLELSGRMTEKRTSEFNNTELIYHSQKIFVSQKNDYIAINKHEILFIRALGKYSEIHTESGQVFLSSKNLKEFEEVMVGNMLRVHHSYLVSIKAIVSYSKEESALKLSNGISIPVSVRRREELAKAFRVF